MKEKKQEVDYLQHLIEKYMNLPGVPVPCLQPIGDLSEFSPSLGPQTTMTVSQVHGCTLGGGTPIQG